MLRAAPNRPLVLASAAFLVTVLSVVSPASPRNGSLFSGDTEAARSFPDMRGTYLASRGAHPVSQGARVLAYLVVGKSLRTASIRSFLFPVYSMNAVAFDR